MASRARRVGLLGGSFDPPHEGHLWMAGRAREGLQLDEIWLLPAFSPPHKSRGLTPYPQRLAMAELLAAEEPFLSVCRIEEELPPPSYSVRTLKALRERYGEGKAFVFIVGEDSLAQMEDWYESDEFFTMAEVAVIAREGAGAESTRPVRWLRGEMHPAQSRYIREALERGEKPGHLTGPVRDYIAKHGLYAGGRQR